MRSVAEHREDLLALVSPIGSESVLLSDALGRVLADDVLAAADAPPFDNSAMDGYAIRVSAGGVGSWRVSQDIPAGRMPSALEPGTVARIMTGAPMPEGADAVVPVEDSDGGIGQVELRTWPVVGRHVRPAGADMIAGAVVVGAPRLLRAADLAAAAAAGQPRVTVARRPRVSIVVTGDELAPPGATLTGAEIYDANSTVLSAAVREWGGEVVSAQRVGDGPAELLRSLEGIEADLIVTAGGVSAGAYDVVKESLASRGVTFGPVAMQPGKPQGWGALHGVPIVCAPGNPVSVAVTFRLFVVPMLCAMLGVPTPPLRRLPVVEGWRSPQGRTQVMPVRILDDAVLPATAGGSGSNLVGSLAAADAYALVPAEVEMVMPGTTVDVMGLVP
ncbi:molybdopterin molybdotransferase MoeA [Demequina salsinemoris]|uniref:molybdopterin molybdotransferase MoeA n=1 Tax=Demequina salsinemoris TaxID=577470 RepID=UPI000A0617F9|nr:gephyrin-like molybdotransferase Glp [Demequina salsinemoris]